MNPETHRVQPYDRERIRCSVSDCGAPADLIEHCHWNTGSTTGLSFFSYCDPCWARILERREAAEAEALVRREEYERRSDREENALLTIKSIRTWIADADAGDEESSDRNTVMAIQGAVDRFDDRYRGMPDYDAL